MRKFSLSLLFLVSVIPVLAQLQSPEQFLGYKLGSRYSPHFRVVDYFKHVAESLPAQVKMEEYGKTNEGRPLVLAYIASTENMARLESIRTANLQLAGINSDNNTRQGNAPAIVWLSYNVHGNETSSSEAAMQTIFDLVNPQNARAREWLRNTVVIIDPCVNPDGRDRYVNWFNSVVGSTPDPNPFTREHVEPWPGGRVNHYYFDLNRDWAWQTQVETKQRIVKYNQWLPHVHVDFHEQGYNEPYYFAPAAEPFHEVITPWQREFQTMIGKNNAKYFDQQGWLYFTKERFDLFYPSYGDTYPTYKGAIGMTYEQGGHSRAGASVINEDGDTLTLLDRLTHHYTTGISTVEITSQNAGKVVQEFKKYYDQARTSPGGEFKAYLLKADAGDRLTRLKALLDRNNINWAYAGTGNFSGLNYSSGRSESVRGETGDIVISANQPNSNLIRVLFERTSQLSDSITYDITSWSLPYVYGVQAYGLSSFVSGTRQQPQEAAPVTRGGDVYAYAIPWTGLNSARMVASLMKSGIRLRYAEQAFSSGGKSFERGTVLVTRASNSLSQDSLFNTVNNAARDAGITYTPLASGFVDKGFDIGSSRIRTMKMPKVGLVSGENVSPLGMGEIWHLLDAELKYPVHVIWLDDLNRTMLSNLDVLIMPDGNYRLLRDKAQNDMLKDWVRSGGRLIAIENAVAQLAGADWGIKVKDAEEREEDKKEKKAVDYSLIRRYENRERDFITGFNPGSVYRLELDNSHPLAFGYGTTYYTLKQDNNIYDYIENNGWNVGVVRKENHVAGFTGSQVKERLRDGVLLGVTEMGKGSVVFFADNPVFRSFWENGKLLMCNAIFMVGQ